MKRLKLFTLVLLTAACASLPVKERAVQTLDGTQKLLAQVQDTERQLCNPEAFKAAPAEPILACTGTVAESSGLTTERHQQVAKALSRAFDLQIKSATVLRAWRAGDPVPASLPEMMHAVEDVAGILKQLAPNSQVANALQSILQVRADLEALEASLKGAR